MKPDRHTGLHINDVGRDATTGEFVMVINCRCTIPHGNTTEYQASHGDGCLMKPSEGLVMETDGERLTGWGCYDVFARTLEPVPAERAEDLKRQMHERLETDRKRTKAANFKGRKNRPVW